MSYTLLVPTLPPEAWIRTCQECGHMQKDNQPSTDKELSNAYRDRKCKKCKSESLDYGTGNASYPYTEDE